MKYLLTILICLSVVVVACGSGGGGDAPIVYAKILRAAFDYHPLKSEAEKGFLQQFTLLVNGKIDKTTADAFKAKGVSLAFYDWLPAICYCPGNPGEWEKRVFENRQQWTLNPSGTEPSRKTCPSYCTEYFYDVANASLIDAKVSYLADKAAAMGYSAVFFDWGTGWKVLNETGEYAFLRDEYLKRHPGTDYDDKVNELFARLKAKKLILIGNASYNSYGAKLTTHLDLDIKESMFTDNSCPDSEKYEIYVNGLGVIAACDSWYNNADRAKDLSTSLTAQARSINPQLPFLFLNYLFPFYKDTGQTISVEGKVYKIHDRTVDRQAVFYSLAASHLGVAAGFSCGPDVSIDYSLDDVYLYTLGTPAGPVRTLRPGTHGRYYSGGFVVISQEEGSVDVEVPSGMSKVNDLYRKTVLSAANGKVTVNLISESYPSGKKKPIGRVFVFEK